MAEVNRELVKMMN